MFLRKTVDSHSRPETFCFFFHKMMLVILRYLHFHVYFQSIFFDGGDIARNAATTLGSFINRVKYPMKY